MKGGGIKHEDSKGTKGTKSNLVHCANRVSTVFVFILFKRQMRNGFCAEELWEDELLFVAFVSLW